MAFLGKKVAAIIPALNEEQSIGLVLNDLPEYIDQVIVCDNGSTDRTANVALSHGAQVVTEEERGYGAACLRAVDSADHDTEILLFVDADYSDYPEEAERLILPIAEGNADLVVGSRMSTLGSHRALQPAAIFGNWLTSRLIRLIWGQKFTDIGPFRAIGNPAYRRLRMKDRNFGWTVEMQVKAVKMGLKCLEVPVSYRKRVGESKISGTLSGSVRAGVKFLWIIMRETVRP